MDAYFESETMRSTPKRPAGGTILDDLPFHLARAALNFRRFNDRTLSAIGLESQAPGIASVLHALHELDDCTVNSLVERTHLPNGTLTGLLDTLEGDRCIQRVPNPDDGRSWHIRLTAKGRQICAKLHQRHLLVMGLFRDVLTERETAELKRLLAQVTTCMRAYTASPDQSPSRSSSRTQRARTSPQPRRQRRKVAGTRS
jgi:DNA-binding MarR family transcriptional regulator